MAQRPRIGAILRDGMRRRSLDQTQVARAVGASRSAVNAWINDRAWPQEKYVAPLEELLGVQLPRWWEDKAPGLHAADLDENEKALMRLDLPPADRDKLLKEYRALRDGGGNSRPRRIGAG